MVFWEFEKEKVQNLYVDINFLFGTDNNSKHLVDVYLLLPQLLLLLEIISLVYNILVIENNFIEPQ